MYEEPVSSKGKRMPRSTMMVLVLGSFALLLCTASALVGGVFLGALVFQSNGFTNSEAIEIAPPAPLAPTIVPPAPADVMPTVPPPDFGRATATPAPFEEGNVVTATPFPFGHVPTAIP